VLFSDQCSFIFNLRIIRHETFSFKISLIEHNLYSLPLYPQNLREEIIFFQNSRMQLGT